MNIMNDIDETVKNLWPIIPNWINYIAIDFDGEVWGFDLYPRPSINTELWLENTYDARYYPAFLTDIGGNCPNWKELIFQRPLNLKN